jgi:hypothetical protein
MVKVGEAWVWLRCEEIGGWWMETGLGLAGYGWFDEVWTLWVVLVCSAFLGGMDRNGRLIPERFEYSAVPS